MGNCQRDGSVGSRFLAILGFSCALYQRYAGRVTAIAADPGDVGTIYLGAYGGGVWKTIDEGQTWEPLTDGAGSLNIASLSTTTGIPRMPIIAPRLSTPPATIWKGSDP